MNVVEAVSIHQDLDPWLSLEALSKASGLSIRSLRGYVADPERPLPHFRMKKPHVIKRKPRPDGTGPRTLTVSGKILVRWSEFQRWMETYRYTPDLDRLVDEVVRELRQ